MSDPVLGALIAAIAAIGVALINQYRQWRADQRTQRAEAIDDELNHSDALFEEYRELVQQHRQDAEAARAGERRAREDLEQERADKRRIRTERDEYRTRALACEEKWDGLIEKKERK